VDAAVAVALLKRKLDKLKGILLSYKRVLVAYSGGVDSSFLLKCSLCYLGKNNVLAVTAVSPTYTRKELETAKEITRDFGVTHKIISTSEVDRLDFKANPENRCYYCKSELFSRLKLLAEKEHIAYILDGSNLDDLKDYRPGRQAKEELGVRSPLAEAGLAKKEIRQLSKEFGLKNWDAPQMACLASRFAYGQEITIENLKRIEKAEDYIRSLGINLVRIRHYQLPDKTKLARIEVNKEDIKKVTGYRLQVTGCLKKLGYNYVTLDLEGYRAGSMNIGITGGKI
jgi:uncharacterized protein